MILGRTINKKKEKKEKKIPTNENERLAAAPLYKLFLVRIFFVLPNSSHPSFPQFPPVLEQDRYPTDISVATLKICDDNDQ